MKFRIKIFNQEYKISEILLRILHFKEISRDNIAFK